MLLSAIKAFVFILSIAAVPLLAFLILLYILFGILKDYQERTERGDAF